MKIIFSFPQGATLEALDLQSLDEARQIGNELRAQGKQFTAGGERIREHAQGIVEQLGTAIEWSPDFTLEPGDEVLMVTTNDFDPALAPVSEPFVFQRMVVR